MKHTLHAQTAAVDVACVHATRRGSSSMKPKDWEMLEPRLKDAWWTLTQLNAARNRPGVAEFLAEIEGGA